MAQLTEWLKLMLAEIARKNEDAALARAEETARVTAPTTEPKAPPTAKVG
jgi:hypothetical protein